jgi:hypothetical protein
MDETSTSPVPDTSFGILGRSSTIIDETKKNEHKKLKVGENIIEKKLKRT